MQATGYAGGHEYIDYGEVVAVLDGWGERDWSRPFQQAMIAIVLIRVH